jgi:hypothetical protein
MKDAVSSALHAAGDVQVTDGYADMLADANIRGVTVHEH